MNRPTIPFISAKKPGDPGAVCPHCESRASIRHSLALTPLIRHIRYRCDNDDCGHVFVAELVVIRTCVMSAIPNGSINIPFSPRTAALPMPANDAAPMPANDDRDDAAIAGPTDAMT